MKNQKNSFRLTNKTAKNLRRQAVTQQNALYVTAVLLSIALTGAGFVLGMEHIVILPVMLLIALGADILLILFARGRYMSLVGQAICTEAAARQLKANSAEQARIETARRDLERIKQDLAMDSRADEEEDEEEGDEDMYAPAFSQKSGRGVKPAPVQITDTRPHTPAQRAAGEAADNHEGAPVQRRRRQARLQVIMSDTPDNKAN